MEVKKVIGESGVWRCNFNILQTYKGYSMNKYKVLTLSLSLLISSIACASQKTIKLSTFPKRYCGEINYTQGELQSVEVLKAMIQDAIGIPPAEQRLTWFQRDSQLGGLFSRRITTPINSNESLKDFLQDHEVKEQVLAFHLAKNQYNGDDNRQINIKESWCTIQ